MFPSPSYQQKTMPKASLFVAENKVSKTWGEIRVDADIPHDLFCVYFCVLIDFFQRAETSSKPKVCS